MKNFRIAVMLNGAEGIDWYEKYSNLWKIKSGLVSDANQAQSVLYYNLATVNSAQPTLLRIVMHAIGHAYAFLLDRIFSDLLTKIRTAIYNGHIGANDNIVLSLFGFNEGASLARHFGVEYIKKRLIQSMPDDLKALGLKIQLDAEYLFDSVCLPVPATVTALNRFSIFNLEAPAPYYQSEIPPGTKCVHLVSLDEFNKLNTPLLVDKTNEDIEEIWVPGDSLDNGGGYMSPVDGSPSSADDAMKHMVMRAKQNGLKFTAEFEKQLDVRKDYISLSPIHDGSRTNLPKHLRQVRNVYVQKNGEVTDETPTVHESVLHRMIHTRFPYYDPSALLPFKQLEVILKDGERASARFEEKVDTPPVTPRYQHLRVSRDDIAAQDSRIPPNDILRKSLSKISLA